MKQGSRVKASVCVCTSDRRSISFFCYAYLIVLELFIKSITSQENFNAIFVCEVSIYIHGYVSGLSLLFFSQCVYFYMRTMVLQDVLISGRANYPTLYFFFMLGLAFILYIYIYINFRRSSSSSLGWRAGPCWDFYSLNPRAYNYYFKKSLCP